MDIRERVREFYGDVADGGGEKSCCVPGCCGASAPTDFAGRVGYTAEQLAAIPEQSNLGLGCGNPTAAAELPVGATVLDLGSGAGIDCFLAASQVGGSGRVIGVDMTPSMVSRARRSAEDSEFENIEFRLGEIEHLPVADDTIDVVISNCVVNLSPDKPAVYGEVLRALRPGGYVVISDVVAIAPIPDELRSDVAALAGCIGNAEHVDTVREMLIDAGFEDVDVQIDERSARLVDEWLDGASDFVASATIKARKPA